MEKQRLDVRRGRVWRPNCQICQSLKKDKKLYKRVMESSYFDPEAQEPIKTAFEMSGYDYPTSSIYQHMKRHQQRDIIAAENKLKTNQEAEMARQAFLDAKGDSQTQAYEGLEMFIRTGRRKLAAGNMQMSAANFLQAIKIKADIDSKNKDRKVDVIKMMRGASGIESKD